MRCVEDLISEAELFDLPLAGRKYTWYRGDGLAMSRLDRFLVSEEWLSTWENSTQWGLERSLSDHCAVLLRDKVVDWDPKHFSILNCWREVSGYAEFVKNNWNSLRVDGWGSFVLKEKLKLIKQKLKE